LSGDQHVVFMKLIWILGQMITSVFG